MKLHNSQTLILVGYERSIVLVLYEITQLSNTGFAYLELFNVLVLYEITQLSNAF